MTRVVPLEPRCEPQARALALELGLDFCAESSAPDPFISVTPVGIELAVVGPGTPGPVRVDFATGAMRHRRRGGQNELLGRAVGVGKRSPLRVIDATAGLGRDAFVLADLGCEVMMLERSPVAFGLLRDGLERSRSSADSWLRETSERLELRRADSIVYLAQSAAAADVVYLDPMFPERQKSARVRKEMALFQELLGADPDSEQLLVAALRVASYRVVVKRPARAPLVAGPAPAFNIAGRKVRFDVYLPAV